MKKYEKMPYEGSRLREWLAADTWSAQEAVCLLSDVDPTGAVIKWGGFTNSFGGHVDSPKIEHGQLLSEEINLSFSEPGERVFEVTSWIDDEPFFDAYKLTSGSNAESQQMNIRTVAERQVRRAWNLYRRNPEHSENDQRPPYEFVEWGKTQRLDIPWLEWAEHNGFLAKVNKNAEPEPKACPTTQTKKTSGTEKTKRREEKKQEITELRDAAIGVAVKLKRDGIQTKSITVRRICQDLFEKTFSNGKPFSSRWRTVEAMRSKLKGVHHPRRSREFCAAKSDRAEFNQ